MSSHPEQQSLEGLLSMRLNMYKSQLTPKLLEAAKNFDEQRVASIKRTVEEQGYASDIVRIDDVRYFIVSDGEISDGVISFIRENSKVMRETMTRFLGSCWHAADMLRRNLGGEVVSNQSWTEKVLEKSKIEGLGNHSVYIEQIEEEWVAFDLTFREWVDNLGSTADAFVIVSTSRQGVLDKLRAIYGQEWKEDDHTIDEE